MSPLHTSREHLLDQRYTSGSRRLPESSDGDCVPIGATVYMTVPPLNARGPEDNVSGVFKTGFDIPLCSVILRSPSLPERVLSSSAHVRLVSVFEGDVPH